MSTDLDKAQPLIGRTKYTLQTAPYIPSLLKLMLKCEGRKDCLNHSLKTLKWNKLGWAGPHSKSPFSSEPEIPFGRGDKLLLHFFGIVDIFEILKCLRFFRLGWGSNIISFLDGDGEQIWRGSKNMIYDQIKHRRAGGGGGGPCPIIMPLRGPTYKLSFSVFQLSWNCKLGRVWQLHIENDSYR